MPARLATVGALALLLSASALFAQDIPVTAHITADNHYALYVGNADGTEMTFIGRNEKGYWGDPGYNNWTLPETWTFTVRADAYLYVVAWSGEPPQAGMLTMWIGDFISPEAILVSNRTQWQSIEIPASGWPGDDGDVNLADVTTAIATGAWVTPQGEVINGGPGSGCVFCWNIPGLDPAARHVWHGYFFTMPLYAVYRAPAALLQHQATCDERLAEAEAEVKRLDAAVATLTAELSAANAEINQLKADTDADGVPDLFDLCPATAARVATDVSGCSVEQFCGTVNATTVRGAQACAVLDWKNDEPLMLPLHVDCRVAGRGAAARCVPAEQ